MATEGGGISEEEEGEHEGDTVPETPVPVILRQCTVLHPDTRECDQDYPVGLFEVEPIEGLQAVAIILVAELDHRLVVAFPDTAWHRSVARRQLSSGAFQKPISVQVDFTDRSLGAPENTFPHKVWLGILAPEFEDKVLFGPDELEEPDIIFASGGPQVLPTADSLVAAFETHFFFSSAVSGGDKPAAASRRTSAVDQRLQRLEETVLTLVDSVKKLVPAEAAPLPKRQSALRAPGTQWPSPPPRVQLPEGADSEVVRAARAAGVSEEDIMEMARLAAQGKSKLTDLPRPRTKANQKNALSESEDEDNEVELLGEAGQHSEGASSHLEKAVVRLTEIAGHLAKEKKKDKSLEALLDGVGAGGGWRFKYPCWWKEACGGFASPSQKLGEKSSADSRCNRAQHGGGFSDEDANPRIRPSPGHSKGMVGDEEQGAGISNPCTIPLGDRWSTRCDPGRPSLKLVLVVDSCWQWEIRCL